MYIRILNCLYINNKNSYFFKISSYFVNFVYALSNKFVYILLLKIVYTLSTFAYIALALATTHY